MLLATNWSGDFEYLEGPPDKMIPTWIGLICSFIGLLLALLFIGFPIFVSFLIVNVIGLLYLVGPEGLGLFVNSIYQTATSRNFSTISLFVLLGEVLFLSGSVEVLFDSVDRLVGRVRGRLYVLTTLLSTLFGALSGSAVAVAAMFGRSLLPDMIKRGYDLRLSVATIMAGSSLAPIIPPSLLAIIIGSLVTNVSIAGLLIGGIGPGLFISAVILTYVSFKVWRNPDAAPNVQDDREAMGFRGALKALARLLPFSVIVFSVMGLILLGIATPTESAATGALGAFVTAALYKRFSWKMALASCLSTVSISGMILIIVASSMLFSQLLSLSGATSELIGFVATMKISHWEMLLLLMIVPFVLCMFIDNIAFMLLAIPLYQPIVAAYGFDPIWFWMMFLIMITVGNVTPPFGYTLFAMRASSDALSIKEIYKASIPVVGILLLSLVMMSIFPEIITWLPGRL